MVARRGARHQLHTLDERVAYLEGRLEDHAGTVGNLRTTVTASAEEMVRRFEVVDRRFDAIDRRFDAIDRKFDAVDGKFAALDQKFDRHFTWLVGIQVATLVAVVGALVGSAAR